MRLMEHIASGLALRSGKRGAALLIACLALEGCGSGGNGSGGNAFFGPDTNGTTEAQQLKELMDRYYYWNDRMPAVDLSSLGTAEAALEALRYRPIDRYSFIEDAQRFNQLYGEGRSVGIGISYRIDGETVRVRMVQPASPAGAAGLARGDTIVSINGQPSAQLARENRVSEAFGAPESGVVVRLGVERSGSASELTITKAVYDVSTVLDSRVFDAGARNDGTPWRIGYINLGSFIGTTNAQWDERLAPILASGVRELIVDLRENGGGLLSSAAHVASTIAPLDASGQTFAQLRYNDSQRALDQRIVFPSTLQRTAFDRVVFLTSPQTCSASESVVNALRPFRPAPTIGETTCGKPVGFNPQPIASKIANFVTFASTNRDGVGDYFDGLAPTCVTGIDPLLPLGDVNDPRIAAAIGWLTTGACPAAPSASIEKSTTTTRAGAGAAPDDKARGPWPWRRGLARVTGLE